MDLDIFPCLFSENEEQRNMARPIVLEAMKNPEFLDFLVQSLSSIIDDPNSNENLFLIQSICVVLREEIVKRKDDLSFFQQTQIYYTYKTSFEIMFKLPFSIRHYFIDILDSIFKYKIFDYVEIMTHCYSIIEQNEDIYDCTTALNLIYLWVSSRTKIGNSVERNLREQLIEKIFPILAQLINQTYSFLSSLPPEFLELIKVSQTQQLKSIITDENELKNFKEKLSIIEAHSNFIEMSAIMAMETQSSEVFILINDFKEIANTFAGVLKLDIHEIKSIIDAKMLICDFFSRIYYMFCSPDAFKEDKRPSINSFASDMGPIIIDSILSSAQNCQESNLLRDLLNVIDIYIFHGLFLDYILADDFFTQILIPSTLLKEDDLQIFYEIPEQYVGFNLSFKKKDWYETLPIRKVIASIIEHLFNHFPQNIEHLFNYLIQPPSDVIEAEAKIFLKTVIFLKFEIPITLADETIQEFKENTQMDDFYCASLLLLLSAMDKNDDWSEYENEGDKKNTNLKDCLEIGTICLLNSNSQVVRLCAIDLLDNIIDDKFRNIVGCNPDSPFCSLIPLSNIIEASLQLATEIHHEEIGSFICNLISTFSNFFTDVSLQFVGQFFQIWSMNKSYDSYDKSSSILTSISTIIMNLPKNCEVLYSILAEITPAILQEFGESKEYNGFKELIDILGCLSDQIDEPPPEFFNSILSMILEYFSNSSIKSAEEEEEEDKNDLGYVYIYMRDFTVVICSLICRQNFFNVDNSVDIIIKIIENLFNYPDKEPLFSSGFMISTCLIQSAAATARSLEESESSSFDPSQFIFLASKAAEFIQNYDESVMVEDEEEETEEQRYDNARGKEFFILAVITLSSALIVNEEAAMELLNEQILNNWIRYHKLSYHVDENKLQFVHWPTIALLNLSKYDINQQGGKLFKIAVEQFLHIKEIEENDDVENEKEIDDLIEFHITDFPFNNLVTDTELANISRDDQRFQFLTEEELEKIQQNLH